MLRSILQLGERAARCHGGSRNSAPRRQDPRVEMRALCMPLLLAALVGAGAARVPLDPGDHWLSLRHDGRTRRYLVHVPPAAASRRALPVLLSFHGAGGTPAGHQRFTRTDSLADREGFLVVYPEGTLSGKLLTWNAGTC